MKPRLPKIGLLAILMVLWWCMMGVAPFTESGTPEDESITGGEALGSATIPDFHLQSSQEAQTDREQVENQDPFDFFGNFFVKLFSRSETEDEAAGVRPGDDEGSTQLRQTFFGPFSEEALSGGEFPLYGSKQEVKNKNQAQTPEAIAEIEALRRSEQISGGIGGGGTAITLIHNDASQPGLGTTVRVNGVVQAVNVQNAMVTINFDFPKGTVFTITITCVGAGGGNCLIFGNILLGATCIPPFSFGFQLIGPSGTSLVFTCTATC